MTISFFEVLSAYGSSADDNVSAFAGPDADTHWFTP
ncbi:MULTISPECIES: potassium-transporting ATPase subunit KdpA [Streptomyces]|nr:potassium-transporting ATPase subunit KdpA [Streptomyces prasinus]